MTRKPAVIAYDISNNKRRRRVRRRLMAWRLDSQYSVFECRLTPREAEELLLQLCDEIDDSKDHLLFIWLDGRRDPVALTRAATIQFNQALVYAG